MADVESLELQITGDAKSAEQSIDSLIQTLGRLKSAAQGGSGLRAISNPLQKISTAVNSLNGAGQKLKDLAGGLKTLSAESNFKISSNIANQINAINNAIKNVTTDLNPIKNLFAAVQPLATMGKGGLGTLINQIKKLPEAVAALNQIDLDAFGAKIEIVAAKMKPLADEMQKVANGFSAFPAKIQKFLNTTDKVPSANARSAVSFANLAAKITALGYTLKRVGGVIASWINESNEYVENLNLFTVAMGEYAEEAQKYAEQVGEVMGIDPSEWMRNQGVFMTLASGFGVAGDRAATMSQQLVQLGYDLSSFYNMDIEEAMQKLKSGFAGELEPLRNLGYDLSQAKLEAVALSLGIDKSVSSMTQAEKAQLRYYAIMEQVTWVQGDMARTLDDPANQLRVLRAQLEQAARALGDLFIPMLREVLPYLIAAAKVVRYLANAISGLFSGGEEETGESNLKDLATSAGGVSEELDNATGSANKLRKTLLGIDELNVMSDPSSSGGGSGIGSGSEFEFELPTMKNWLDTAVGEEIDKIVEKMKAWLGITEDIDSWSELMDTRFGTILKTVGLIGGALLAWKVTSGFLAAIDTLKALLDSPVRSIAVGAILTITGFTMEFDGIKDSILNGLNGFNFSEILVGALTGTGGAAILGAGIGKFISTAFKGSGISTLLATAGKNLGVGTAGAAGAALSAGVAGIIAGIPMLIAGIYDALTTEIDWMNSTLTAAGATAAGAGIGTIIGACGGPLTAGIGALIGLAVGLVVDGVILITQKGEEIVRWFDGVRSKFDTWASGLRGKISDFFDGIVSKIAQFSPKIAKYFEDAGIDILTTFDTIKLKIDRFLTNCRNVVDVLHKLFNGDFAGAWASFKKLITDGLKSIGNEGVIFLNGMIAKFEATVNYFIRGINRIISGINKISFDVPDWVPGIGGKSVGFSIKSVSEVSLGRIPSFASGGFPAEGELFWARESGAGPELVGSIGNRSAVANNDQIVESVSRGVYQAVVSAMGQSGGNQVVEAKVNDKVLFEVVVNRNRQETMRTGYSPLLGGV